ncbi:sterol desaturase family protein [Sphingomonas baiyangensis]|uniref:Beta-carotene hydroxylase n=1 Tax=Sphingomonas baiyangensis TaxID=2572576 RepID=A0A4U1L0M4_9SPHN|nr:sterol desaturase family protein [Sphingomonas baiyangensis]TKD50289.1 beta-carotene hydroxylase [Sphingomonas baiyangensis]
MTAFEKLAIVVGAIAFMEVFAWTVHKYVMHGWGWGWHRDHHEPHDHALERNDLYAVVFGSFVSAMFVTAWLNPQAAWSEPLWWTALGITCYGLIYAFIHDGLVHQRFFRWVPKRGYAKRLVQAHKLHHATIGKEGGVSFGFILAPDPQRLKAELKRQKAAGIATVRPAAVD